MMKCVVPFNASIRIVQVQNWEAFRRLVVPLGYITTDELREVLRRMNQNITEQRMKEVLREIDTDQDGKISYSEFVHLLQLSWMKDC